MKKAKTSEGGIKWVRKDRGPVQVIWLMPGQANRFFFTHWRPLMTLG